MPTYNNALTNQPANRLAYPGGLAKRGGSLDSFVPLDYSRLAAGQFRQDTPQMREYAANVPVDVMRGRLAGMLGFPSDVLNMFRTPSPMEMFGQTDYEQPTQVPYGSEQFLKTLPLAPAENNPLGRVANRAGSLVPFTPMEALQAARLARQAAMATGTFVAPKAGQLAEGYMQRMGMMPSIVERANPNTVWYRGQTGAKSAENPFDSTIRGTPSLADSPAVASEYAMNPNAAGNYGLLGAEDVSGAVVQPYTTSGKVFNINEYQGGHGTETGITQENLKKIAKEMGVDPSKLTDELMENFSQKWGKGKNAYWDTTERGSKSKNKIIPAWVVAENQTLIDAAKKKGIDSIQFKGALSDANAYDSLLPWNEKVTHQELRPLNREAISSTFESPRTNNLAPQQAALPVENSNMLSYRGEHTAPGPDFGAPLHDLTGGGQMYPADVYSSKAAQYYGGGTTYDQKAFSIAQQYKDKPNALVTIYRAVPKEMSNSDKLANLEKQMAAYMKRGTLPKDAKTTDGSKWYDAAFDQREKLRQMPDTPNNDIGGINPGDWVTLTKEYAKDHGESVLLGKYKILSQKVKAKDVWTNADSIHEFGYQPTP